jgi:hypothetical protein
MDAPLHDPRFRPAPLLIADARAHDALARRRSLKALARGDAGFDVWIAHGLEGVRARLFSGKRGPTGGGRPRLRGAYVCLDLPERGLEVVDFLLERYRRTPIVAYSAFDAATLEAGLADLGVRFTPRARLGRIHADSFEADLGAALAGSVTRVARDVLVVREGALLSQPWTAAQIEHRLFVPWDARGLALRRFAVAHARQGEKLAEHYLRTIEAYCEDTPQGELWHVRGMNQKGMTKHLCLLRNLLGGIDHLDRLEKAFNASERAATYASADAGSTLRARRGPDSKKTTSR